jgi:hypothetical protein
MREPLQRRLIPPNEVSTLEAQRSRERAQLIEAPILREGATIESARLIGVPQETVIELTDSLEATVARGRTGRFRRSSSRRSMPGRNERR